MFSGPCTDVTISASTLVTDVVLLHDRRAVMRTATCSPFSVSYSSLLPRFSLTGFWCFILAKQKHIVKSRSISELDCAYECSRTPLAQGVPFCRAASTQLSAHCTVVSRARHGLCCLLCCIAAMPELETGCNRTGLQLQIVCCTGKEGTHDNQQKLHDDGDCDDCLSAGCRHTLYLSGHGAKPMTSFARH